LVQVSSLSLDASNFPVMVHGAPGAGKTHLIGTLAKLGKRVAFIDVGGGTNTLFRQLTVEERRLIKIIGGVRSLRDFQEMFAKYVDLLKKADVVALDCLTPFQKFLSREARAEISKGGDPNELITDKTYSIPVNDAIKFRLEDCVNAILGLPGQKIFTFWSRENGSGIWEPNTRGDVWQYVAGFCDLNLFLRAEPRKGDFGDDPEAQQEVDYKAYTKPVGAWIAKDRHNIFPSSIDPDFAEIYRHLEEA